MSTWESILEDYLEGALSRATAESLRFRIALPAEARREVEAVLRLADRLADATRRARPIAGASERLRGRLRFAGNPTSSPNWLASGGDFVAPEGASRPGAGEDAVNAAIEGTADSVFPATGPDPARPAEQGLVEFNRIAAAVSGQKSIDSEGSVPPGAVERLRSKLAESFAADEGGASPVVARKILARLRGEAVPPSDGLRLPDVLAAGKEPDDDDNPTNPPAPGPPADG